MLIELECPDCGEKHFFDVDISCVVKKAPKTLEEAIQFCIEHIEFKGVMKSEDVLNNL